MKTVPNSLRILRSKTALSVRELAGLIDAKPGTVYAYENGQNTIHPDVAKIILDALATHGLSATLDELYEDSAIEIRRAA